MARTKNTKRARVEGESSASARLVASSHYMARWLPSQRTLKNYVENFESRPIVPPRYITAEFIHGRYYNLVWNALQTQHLIDFVQTRLDYYPNLVKAVYSTLNYVVPEPDEVGEEHYRITLQELAEQWNLVYHGAKFTGGIGADEEWGEYNRIIGLQSLQYENPQMDARAKIDDSTLRQMGRDPNAQESQVQGEPQDPERQDRQTEAVSRQGEAIDLLYTNLGITNPRGIIPRPGP
ncbi:hypothetical protein HN51_028514 [Arachis hypogaea]